MKVIKRGNKTNLYKVLRGIEEVNYNTEIDITVHCVINKLNIDEVPKILEYANNIGVKFTVSNLIPINNKISDSLVCSIEEILNMLKKNGICLKNINHDCNTCKNIFGIKTNGIFTPCLWISNYTNKYDKKNLNELVRDPLEKYEDMNSCLAMYINKELKNKQQLIKSLTAELN